jgi:hypothetical protein
VPVREAVRSTTESAKRLALDGLSTVRPGRLLALETKTVLDSRWRAPRPKAVDATTREWLDELGRSGICVVPGFLTPDRCVELQAEVDEAMRRHAGSVTVDSAGADHRLFLGAAAANGLTDVFNHPALFAAARGVLGRHVTNVALLAIRIRATPSNRGSGQGWHRDSYTNQFKSVIYLTDVAKVNGPLQYIEGSHRIWAKAVDDARMEQALGRRPRYTRAQVRRLLEDDPSRLLTVVAPAGSLLLVDTTGIHRGTPVRRGERYALSNYFYPARLAGHARFRPRYTVVNRAA